MICNVRVEREKEGERRGKANRCSRVDKISYSRRYIRQQAKRSINKRSNWMLRKGLRVESMERDNACDIKWHKSLNLTLYNLKNLLWLQVETLSRRGLTIFKLSN